ncbi:MAG: methyltransferase domain-containing protein [Burkholderiaceae bacterium]|nr:methyltransferase domain-containing protein [Burkholderiaceae bacterium]
MEPIGALSPKVELSSSVSWLDRLGDRWCAWRDGLVGTRRFRRWAAGFPLTRPIARKRARGLFDLVAGFVYSQVLLACVRLRLFDMLAEAPQTLSSLAPRLGLSEDAAQRLLMAAVSLDLLELRSRGRFGLGPLGAPLVGDAAVTSMVEHHAELYVDLADPVALLRGEARTSALAQYWPYAAYDAPGALQADRVTPYSALMSASQTLVSDEVLDAYSFEHHRRLLDVGGGEGTFLSAVAARAPHLKLVLFDLPAVAERARIKFAEQGLTDRATVAGGSFFSDPLPTGCDVISLVRVIFDHDDARALQILKAVRRALPDGGTLLLTEPMSGTRGAEAMGDAYFGFYLLAMGKGRSRSADQLTELLKAAGFGEVRLLRNPMPLQTQLIVARPARV